MVDLIREFLNETHDNLAAFDDDMLLLEREPSNRDVLARVFRVLHTIKGSCGFLKLPRLEKMGRWGEYVLAYFRDEKQPITPQAVALLLRLADAIRMILRDLEHDGTEPLGDDTALENAFNVLMASKDKNTLPDDTQAQPTSPQGETSAVRVAVDLLEDVMNQMSELILARNDLMDFARDHTDPLLLQKIRRLDGRVADLQDTILMTRMQPVRRMWQGLSRAVHDITRDTGKKMTLVMTGDDTELDRHIADELRDIFLHLIRNAADHGIESPQERVRAGKAETGTIRLHAEQHGGRIIITVEDDGRGIDHDAIHAQAAKNGLSLPANITQLLFTPGFSTARQITDLSGRGVGLDVVKTHLENVGGTIVIDSNAGKFCRFTLSVPLTLAIIPAVLVTVGRHLFTLPQSVITQLIRLRKNETPFEKIGEHLSLHWHGETIPVIALSDILKIDDDKSDHITVIILHDTDGSFGVIVDHVTMTKDIIAKPLPYTLKALQAFSGTTILGDGTAILILHPGYLAAHAALSHPDKPLHDKTPYTSSAPTEDAATDSYLLFAAANDVISAVPLHAIERLERIDVASIDRRDTQAIIPYRGEIMPLIGYEEKPSPFQHIVVITYHNRLIGVCVERIIDIVYGNIPVYPPHPMAPPDDAMIGTAIVEQQTIHILDIHTHVAHLTARGGV